MQVCPDLGHAVSLRRLLPDAEIVGADDVAISGCACDSRQVREGDLFAALPGSRCDGYDFVAEASARGCVAVLSERSAPKASQPWCVVRNAHEAYSRICHGLAGNPSRRLKLIGVTGTNGKTTTSCLIAGVLRAAGYGIGVLGSLGCLDGRIVEHSTRATPPPDRLAALLSRMVRNGCSHAVMEVSSRVLDRSGVAGAWFDAACVTNITHSGKAKLFEHLAEEGFAVLNADDPGSANLLHHLDGPVLTVGIDSAAEISATPIEQHMSEQTFLLTAGSESVPVRTQMIGRHHIYNCLTAAALGLAYGIELHTVAAGLELAGHVPGRLERIECGQPFGVFVDLARTPKKLNGALDTLRQVTAGRVICVFSAGAERRGRSRPLIGHAVEKGAKVAIVTSDNARDKTPLVGLREVLDGFHNPRSVEVIPDRVAAIRRALAIARPGDCVLLAGGGRESYTASDYQLLPPGDGEVARQWLYGHTDCLTGMEN
jgi:UDP-N-acetylmuramoyl-L-alanyl-D-glutamate--2,6-diaminopimelate ligase